jgi:hypothetical protein
MLHVPAALLQTEKSRRIYERRLDGLHSWSELEYGNKTKNSCRAASRKAISFVFLCSTTRSLRKQDDITEIYCVSCEVRN